MFFCTSFYAQKKKMHNQGNNKKSDIMVRYFACSTEKQF